MTSNQHGPYVRGYTNYNRDVEIFPVLKAMFDKIVGECPYKSPTDMGVNMAGNCIFDDEAVSEASRQEIVRRYYTALCAQRQGTATEEIVYKLYTVTTADDDIWLMTFFQETDILVHRICCATVPPAVIHCYSWVEYI